MSVPSAARVPPPAHDSEPPMGAACSGGGWARQSERAWIVLPIPCSSARRPPSTRLSVASAPTPTARPHAGSLVAAPGHPPPGGRAAALQAPFARLTGPDGPGGASGESGERATCRREGFGLARGGGGGLSLSESLRKTISGSARFSLAIRVAVARRSDSAAARRSDSAATSSSRCNCCANARSASSCSRFRLASDASETRPGQRDAASRTQDGKSISSTSSSSVVDASLMSLEFLVAGN
eukprot:scaffold7804_cov65-Phaeocystis_antarctica.AAC.7